MLFSIENTTQSGVNKWTYAHDGAYFAHLLANIAIINPGMMAGSGLARFFEGNLLAAIRYNLFYINHLLHELFQLLEHLIRVVLDRELHAVLG